MQFGSVPADPDTGDRFLKKECISCPNKVKQPMTGTGIVNGKRRHITFWGCGLEKCINDEPEIAPCGKESCENCSDYPCFNHFGAQP